MQYFFASQQSFRGIILSSCGVVLCSEFKKIKTPYINQRFEAFIMYPVKIFINVTYSFMDCQIPNCSGDLELQLTQYSYDIGDWYTSGEGIMPENHIIPNTREGSTGTKNFFFDPDTSGDFQLTLTSHDSCVTVSRVLVYRYECPGHDRQSMELGRQLLPAPLSGAIVISAERSHVSYITVQEALICTSQGKWLECEYSENEVTCKGKL